MEDRWWHGGRGLHLWVLTVSALLAVSLRAQAFQEPYSISQISPNSAGNREPRETDGSRLETSAASYDDIVEEEVSEGRHVIVERSAAPILHDTHKSKAYDPYAAVMSNNVDEPIDVVEVRPRSAYYDRIQPTKTQHVPQETSGGLASSSTPGEARGVPKGRSLTPPGPRSTAPPTATPTLTIATSPRVDSTGRQSNPEIQDIITGIVKLLKGNVNVQANTQPANGGRPPSRPPNTRINNRGPPRISDVPPLPPDFDTPGLPGTAQLMPPLPPQPSTKIPPPYPFDRPPVHEQTPVRPFLNGIPIPEQIVPVVSQNYRPNSYNGGIRPQNIPPWQRPRPPRPPINNRRPNPNLPMYKPHTDSSAVLNQSGDGVYTTISKIEEPVLKPKPPINESNKVPEEYLDVSTVGNAEDDVEYSNEISTTATPVAGGILDGENFVKSREPPPVNQSSSVADKTISVQSELLNLPTKQEVLKDSDSNDKKKQTMIKNEKEKPTSNKKQDDKLKDSEPNVKNTIQLGENDAIKATVPLNASLEPTPVLESSMVDVTKENTIKQNSTAILSINSAPTESLPNIKTINTSTGVISTTSAIQSTNINTQSSLPAQQGFPYQPYKPRPGIVLDDTEYRPGGQGGSSVRRPVLPQRSPAPYGEIFDVTVSAIQGPNGGSGSATVQIESVNPISSNSEDIIVSASGDQGFVSIDGKRTYLNLFGDATPTASVHPTPTQKTPGVSGTGYVVPDVEAAATRPSRPQTSRPGPPIPPRRPHQPPVRIDTCIVGDDSTCDQTQNERCKTEAGISSCHCRPGYAKRNHRDPCRKVVAMVFSLRVDKMYDRRVSWDEKLNDRESEFFQKLSYETIQAVDSAFSMTPYSDEFVSGSVNTIYRGDLKNTHGVYVNVTILLEESGETLRGGAGADITRHLLGVIQRRSNNVGASALWVDRPTGSVSRIQDLDECSSPELNDCHEMATCTNIWGSFKCECPEESKDVWAEQPNRAGRHCHTCPSSHCSNRGTCSYRAGQPVCSCNGAYYGSQCEVDGEVVGVAVGSSLAALVVILATLACLVMWSRRWSREQKAAAMGSPVFGYMTGASIKSPPLGQPAYQVTLEERMRWAQLADVMAQANHYAQPEPIPAHPGTRPQSAMYGAYPTLSMAGTLPPVPMPRLGLMGSTLHLNHGANKTNTMNSRANTISCIGQTFGLNHSTESTSSESDSHAQDRADLLGSRNFHVPRPKSRSNATNSIANQSGIYYDVDYENAPDPIYGTKGIPLSTYTMNRGFYGQ